jgi:hypothetical protein
MARSLEACASWSPASPNPRLAEFDGAALLADQEMVIAAERGVPRAALLVAENREYRLVFFQRL